MDPTQLLNLFQTGGAIVVLTFVVVCLLRGWLVPGIIYTQALRDCNDWKELALQNTENASRAVDLAARRRLGANRKESGDAF